MVLQWHPSDGLHDPPLERINWNIDIMVLLIVACNSQLDRLIKIHLFFCEGVNCI